MSWSNIENAKSCQIVKSPNRISKKRGRRQEKLVECRKGEKLYRLTVADPSCYTGAVDCVADPSCCTGAVDCVADPSCCTGAVDCVADPSCCTGAVDCV